MSSVQQRLRKNLQVVTQKDEAKDPKQLIQVLADGVFQEKYSVGDKVMDSTHKHMEIRYATRRDDNFKVVVKLRYKPGCFVSKTEEREWRRSTEYMLSLPPCEGVAQLFEVCEDSKAFYIVTELASGMDLYELMHSTTKSLTVEATKEVMLAILKGIAHFHEHGSVHKDLKLENIVVDAGKSKNLNIPGWSPKSVKIIDFDTVEEWCPQSPKAKDVLGTDQYIAQEAYAGTYSPCSDIFSIGVIFYRLVSGKFPFNDGIFDDQPGENWVGSPKMNQIRSRLKNVKIDWTQDCFVKNPALTELCERMLAYSETRRPTAKEALMSEFFGGPGLPQVTSQSVSSLYGSSSSTSGQGVQSPIMARRTFHSGAGTGAEPSPPTTPGGARRTLAAGAERSLQQSAQPAVAAGSATPKNSRPCSSSFNSLPPVKGATTVR
eukprot:gnl/MRDRNA2_/MRDRNA2_56075_c0_seq1.p1 gnl/MRDRNA2_/MRDRNA2_56075_c0~~gnl/MRDRNA2_/MRDRNA2_56075_c0_seq1.p1  ORF type:complete len:433 (+),score=69.77 gnl/MRDRNA2_/MRDRNA2_56075_c0_seq1:83-1381(+)